MTNKYRIERMKELKKLFLQNPDKVTKEMKELTEKFLEGTGFTWSFTGCSKPCGLVAYDTHTNSYIIINSLTPPRPVSTSLVPPGRFRTLTT